jgi:hypothetical protein
MQSKPELAVGDRLRLSGGYDFEPQWLGSASFLLGTLVDFIPGQNKQPAAVVKLDSPIGAAGEKHTIVVLELRYVGATWVSEGVVHVELCERAPEAKAWSGRAKGRWVESHASYERVAETV